MRFALLGSHPDGLAMAIALVQSGRHELAAYTTPATAEKVRLWSPAARLVGDLEEVRAVAGEIAEVFGFATRESVEPGEPLLLAGRFERGGLFQASFLSHQPQSRWRLAAVGSRGRAELLFPLGRTGPAFLSWHDAT